MARAVVLAFQRGYRVDSNGRLFSSKGRAIRQWTDKRGYKRYNIKDESGQTGFAVHALQAYQLFGDASLQPGIQVRHLDGNPLNNRPENIAIGSASDNNMDKPRSVRVRIAKHAAARRRKISFEEAVEARAGFQSGALRLVDIMDRFGIAKSTASYLVNSRTYITP